MITTTYLSKGKLASGDIGSIEKIRTEIWVDCFNPTKAEIHELSRISGILEEDFTRALDEDERPGIMQSKDYAVIVFHAPFHKKNHTYTTVPFVLLIKQNMLIILRKKNIDAIDNVWHLSDEKKVGMLEKDMTYTLYMMLSEVVNHYFRVSDEFESMIDRIETSIFKNHAQKTVKEIFTLKKSLIYFHKSLTGNREVLSEIEKRFLKEIKGPNVKNFFNLYNDVIQLIDMVATYRDVLSSSLDIYMSSVSNNMNEVVKKLTVIASFIMIPTLISGIYGMNFNFMPEIHVFDRWGYPFALALMLGSILIMHYYFKKMKWL